jgi:hypothetical protein
LTGLRCMVDQTVDAGEPKTPYACSSQVIYIGKLTSAGKRQGYGGRTWQACLGPCSTACNVGRKMRAGSTRVVWLRVETALYAYQTNTVPDALPLSSFWSPSFLQLLKLLVANPVILSQVCFVKHSAVCLPDDTIEKQTCCSYASQAWLCVVRLDGAISVPSQHCARADRFLPFFQDK